MVHDIETDKPRGYAFIEYEDESSMHGKKIKSLFNFFLFFFFIFNWMLSIFMHENSIHIKSFFFRFEELHHFNHFF